MVANIVFLFLPQTLVGKTHRDGISPVGSLTPDIILYLGIITPNCS